jgi:hypothetical protein
MHTHTRTLTIAALAVFALAPTALAQPQPAGASAEADTLFDEGRKAMDAGDFKVACKAFDASQKLSPAVSTMINLAYCREQNKEFASAYGWFREAERQTRVPLDEATQKMNKLAAEQADELEPRLSKIKIVVAAPSIVDGMEVFRDDLKIDKTAWNQDLPVDGGKHTIKVRAPKYLDWSTTVDVGIEKDHKAVEVAVLVLAPIPPQPLPTRKRALPFVVGGAGLLMIGGAIALDILARADYDKALKEEYDPAQEDYWNKAKTKRYIAQGVAAGGVAAIAVGVWLFVKNVKYEKANGFAQATSLHVEPALAWDHVGVQVFRAF